MTLIAPKYSPDAAVFRIISILSNNPSDFAEWLWRN